MTPLTPVGRWLAIDYGRRRIGLALSDELGISSRPLATIDLAALSPGGRPAARQDWEPPEAALAEAARRIAAACREHDVRGLVVGDPRHPSGEPLPIGPWIDAQVERLGRALAVVGLDGLARVRVDEHGSSQAALSALGGSGRAERDHREAGRLDGAAAAVLLQEFLDHGGPASVRPDDGDGRTR